VSGAARGVLSTLRIMSDASLVALLAPKTVAVVGASRSRTSVGGEIFANLVGRPFAGPVYPVNATASHVQGVRAYRRIAEVPDTVDLAVIAVPASKVPQILVECAQGGVKAAVIITAGFGESGDEETRAQAAIVATARQTGMRLVGPNCLGILSTDPDVALHATFSTGWPPRGNVSIASQSGALGIALLDEARDHGIGVRHFVSLGNEADVSAEDLLEYWEGDAETRVIVLYLESLRDPRRFLDVARRVSRTKPIVAVKGGRSSAGARAAGSHTGALATRDAVVDALLTQAGIVRAATLEELFDAAALLAAGCVPTGKSVAIVTNAGGPGILAADACAARGLSVPAFDGATARALAGAVPEASVRNPVDLVASAQAETFDVAIPIALGDHGINALLVACVPTTSADVREVARVIANARSYATKPVVACIMGKRGVEVARAILHEAHVPVYSLPESAASALAAAASYAECASRTEGTALRDGAAVAAAQARILARTGGGDSVEGRWLAPHETSALLDACGIRCLPSVQATDADAATRAASTLG
jgi:acetate---CoA ligase (ADP-forming)